MHFLINLWEYVNCKCTVWFKDAGSHIRKYPSVCVWFCCLIYADAERLGWLMDRKGNHSVGGAELIFASGDEGHKHTHIWESSVECVCVCVCFIGFHMLCASDFACTVSVLSEGSDAWRFACVVWVCVLVYIWCECAAATVYVWRQDAQPFSLLWFLFYFLL